MDSFTEIVKTFKCQHIRCSILFPVSDGNLFLKQYSKAKNVCPLSKSQVYKTDLIKV